MRVKTFLLCLGVDPSQGVTKFQKRGKGAVQERDGKKNRNIVFTCNNAG